MYQESSLQKCDNNMICYVYFGVDTITQERTPLCVFTNKPTLQETTTVMFRNRFYYGYELAEVELVSNEDKLGKEIDLHNRH